MRSLSLASVSYQRPRATRMPSFRLRPGFRFAGAPNQAKGVQRDRDTRLLSGLHNASHESADSDFAESLRLHYGPSVGGVLLLSRPGTVLIVAGRLALSPARPMMLEAPPTRRPGH